eukprot:4666415-Prymnesium_polylepis.1
MGTRRLTRTGDVKGMPTRIRADFTWGSAGLRQIFADSRRLCESSRSGLHRFFGGFAQIRDAFAKVSVVVGSTPASWSPRMWWYVASARACGAGHVHARTQHALHICPLLFERLSSEAGAKCPISSVTVSAALDSEERVKERPRDAGW